MRNIGGLVTYSYSYVTASHSLVISFRILDSSSNSVLDCCFQYSCNSSVLINKLVLINYETMKESNVAIIGHYMKNLFCNFLLFQLFCTIFLTVQFRVTKQIQLLHSMKPKRNAHFESEIGVYVLGFGFKFTERCSSILPWQKYFLLYLSYFGFYKPMILTSIN